MGGGRWAGTAGEMGSLKAAFLRLKAKLFIAPNKFSFQSMTASFTYIFLRTVLLLLCKEYGKVWYVLIVGNETSTVDDRLMTLLVLPFSIEIRSLDTLFRRLCSTVSYLERIALPRMVHLL